MEAVTKMIWKALSDILLFVDQSSRVMHETFYADTGLKGQTFSKPDKANPEWSDVIEGSVGLMRIAFACRERPYA